MFENVKTLVEILAGTEGNIIMTAMGIQMWSYV